MTSPSSPGDEATSPPVRQLRLVVTVDDVDAAADLLENALGLDRVAEFGEAGAQALLFRAGVATLEIGNAEHARQIDDLEVGRRVAPRFRVALEVDDVRSRTQAVSALAGVEVLAGPVETPWGSLNSRLQAPDDLQLTLFEQVSGEPELES
jgi:catechol 2,3-dioxygenase-like lactoylglutathione lyase family enzyme